MNYLKQLWQQFYLNDECSSEEQQQKQKQKNNNKDEKTAQQSGQFQVIDINELTFNQESVEKDEISSQNPQLSNGNCKQQIRTLQQNLKSQNLYCKNAQQVSTLQATKLEDIAIKNKLAKEYMIIELNPLKQSQKLPALQVQEIQLPQNSRSASTIQMDEYYMIVDSEELTKTFSTESEWKAFYQKVNDFNKRNDKKNSRTSINEKSEQLMGCEKIENQSSSQISYLNSNKKQKISLTLKELNSILEIQAQDLQRREQYWSSIAVPSTQITFKSRQLANKNDAKNLTKFVNKIMDSFVHILINEIAETKYKVIENIQWQMDKWKSYILRLLTVYGANDRQIGYSKGLEHLVIGLLVAVAIKPNQQNKMVIFQQQPSIPEKNDEFYDKIQTHFKYLMITKNLRNMYFPSTPKLYPQIQALTELMRLETPTVYEMLEEMKVEFIKLFINYYKTFLLYKIINPQVIRKIMQLLIIYGLDLVKIVIIRILVKQQKKIIEKKAKKQDVLKFIAEQMVGDYFEAGDGKQVIIKFKNLFVLDSQL